MPLFSQSPFLRIANQEEVYLRSTTYVFLLPAVGVDIAGSAIRKRISNSRVISLAVLELRMQFVSYLISERDTAEGGTVQ
jgi:hypothetical protein